jgi:circadian clock protein KaiC
MTHDEGRLLRQQDEAFARVSTGDAGADRILGGGFPANTINIVMGQPGTGKTIFTEQIVFAHAAEIDRPILYLTTLSEPLAKVVRFVQDFAFFDESRIGSDVIYEDVGADLAEKGVASLVTHVRKAIMQMSPRIVVIDSFKAIHDLSDGPAETRRVMHDLSGLLTAYDTTSFLIGEYEQADIGRYPEFAVADGLVELSRRQLGARDDRYFRVLKLRGSRYLAGAHALRITGAGVEVFPRLVTPRHSVAYESVEERISTGVEGLDAMLGGGLRRGSTTFLVGPSGSGKTTLALQFAIEGARAGEPCLYVHFQENPSQLARTVRELGTDPAALDALDLYYTSPVELQIDTIIGEMFKRIGMDGVQRLVIDAMGDLATSAGDPQRLNDYLYSLVQHLAGHGVTSVITNELAAKSTTGARLDEGPISHLADNLIMLELTGDEETRRTVRILKTRGSAHDPKVRQVRISATGASIA